MWSYYPALDCARSHSLCVNCLLHVQRVGLSKSHRPCARDKEKVASFLEDVAARSKTIPAPSNQRTPTSCSGRGGC